MGRDEDAQWPPEPADSSSTSATSESEESDSSANEANQSDGNAEAQAAPADQAAPAGTGDRVVSSGECVSSIAKDTGHFWETIWNDPANEPLKAVRTDPNVLLPGDRLTVPEKKRKEEPGATEVRHRFMRRGEPAKLKLCIMKEDDVPRANEPYVLEAGGKTFEGITDVNGQLSIPIPGNCRRGKLTVGPPEDQVEYELELGGMDPVSAMEGVIARLNNLGFEAGPPSKKVTEKCGQALSEFQERHGLPVTGQPDEATRQKLLAVHGS